jgi:hypothetical protein
MFLYTIYFKKLSLNRQEDRGETGEFQTVWEERCRHGARIYTEHCRV